jgi:hypothetical protein
VQCAADLRRFAPQDLHKESGGAAADTFAPPPLPALIGELFRMDRGANREEPMHQVAQHGFALRRVPSIAFR